MLSSQLGSSSSGPTTGFLRGSGLDCGPYPVPFSLTNLLHRLGQAQTRLHHVWGRESRVQVPAAPLATGRPAPRPITPKALKNSKENENSVSSHSLKHKLAPGPVITCKRSLGARPSSDPSLISVKILGPQ